MKRRLIILALAGLLLLLAGCGNPEKETEQPLEGYTVTNWSYYSYEEGEDHRVAICLAIQNEGDAPLTLSDVSIRILDQDGGELQTLHGVKAYPSAAGLDETIYVCADELRGTESTKLQLQLLRGNPLVYRGSDPEGYLAMQGAIPVESGNLYRSEDGAVHVSGAIAAQMPTNRYRDICINILLTGENGESFGIREIRKVSEFDGAVFDFELAHWPFGNNMPPHFEISAAFD